jgi:hypothetical protein
MPRRPSGGNGGWPVLASWAPAFDGCAGLEAFDRDAEALVAAVAKAETAQPWGNVDFPTISRSAGALSVEGASQIRRCRKLKVFKCATAMSL